MKKYLTRLKQAIKFKFEDENLEKEYNQTMMRDQKIFIFCINVIFVMISGLFVYNVYSRNYPHKEYIKRGIILAISIINLIIFKFLQRISEYSLAIASSIFFLYIYSSYDELYTNTINIFSAAQIMGIFEVILYIVNRNIYCRIAFQLSMIAMKILYVNAINTYIVTIVTFVFWVTLEKCTRRTFKNMGDERNKAKRFQTLISNDFPLNFFIVNMSERKILFENEKAKLTFNSTSERSLILKQLVCSKTLHGTQLLDNYEDQLTLSEYIDEFIMAATTKELTLQSKINPTFIDKISKFSYELKVIRIEWEHANCLGLILGDITEKQRLENLKKVNEYKDLVIASVSHELRTPLNGILGIIKMIMDRVKDPEVLTSLENCNSCAKLLLHFVNSILDSSQIDAQKIQLNQELIKISDLTKEIFSLYNFQATHKNIKFQITCDTNLPTHINVDKYRLLQVLINLISNAIKFTPKGFVSLIISLEDQKDKIRFSVEDSGIGIKPEDIKYLFKKFGKLEQADKNINARGVGLGLSISNELVKVLNKNREEGISVVSAINQGSKFTFYIPYLNQMMISSSGENEENSVIEINSVSRYKFETISRIKFGTEEEFEKLNESPAKIQKKKCLVVDDNSYNLIAATYILKSLNLDFSTALSGNEAIEVLSHDEFDIIFMDIQMPVLDGIETSKILLEKMNKNLIKKTPIIALTANGEGNRDSYLKVGMLDMVLKPVTQDKISKVIKKYT